MLVAHVSSHHTVVAHLTDGTGVVGAVTLALAAAASFLALVTTLIAAAALKDARTSQQRDRLAAQNRHFQEMIFQVQQLKVATSRGYSVGHPDWSIPRNRLQVLTFGIDEVIPQTKAVLTSARPVDAPLDEAELELTAVIEKAQRVLFGKTGASQPSAGAP